MFGSWVNVRPVRHVSSHVTPRFVLLAAAAAAMLTLASGAPAAAHGAPTSPTSRTASCGAEGDASDTAACRAALRQSPKLAEQWDNVRVADVRGRDREVIPDGKLCSAGIRAYAGLDLARADWPVTTLSPGADQRFTYRGTIGHHGTFRLYVTRPGYSPDRQLTWSDLEPEPFLTVVDPPLHGGSYRFEGALPADRSGRQLIYTIWQNSDTPDTYYSCSDVDFGAGRPEAAAAPPPSPPHRSGVGRGDRWCGGRFRDGDADRADRRRGAARGAARCRGAAGRPPPRRARR